MRRFRSHVPAGTCVNLTLFVGFIAWNIFPISGLRCYKFACWGEECSLFRGNIWEDVDLIDQCPDDAMGCLHSMGSARLDPPLARIWEATGQSVPDLLLLRRETRSCWVPGRGFQISRGEIGHCMPTGMSHFNRHLREMLLVNSIECICSGDLCNGEVVYSYAVSISFRNPSVFILPSLLFIISVYVQFCFSL